MTKRIYVTTAIPYVNAEPWKALTAGDQASTRPHLSKWLSKLHCVAWWLSPFLPDGAERVLELLSRRAITACEQLFPKIE